MNPLWIPVSFYGVGFAFMAFGLALWWVEFHRGGGIQ